MSTAALYESLHTRILGRVPLVSDLFTRADAASLGTGYTTVLGTVGVTSNRCAVQAANDNLATVDNSGIGNDQYAQAAWYAGDGYLAVRVTGSGSNATDAYLLLVQSGVGSDKAYLAKWENIPGGTYTSLDSADVTRTPGDVWRLQVVGTALKVYQNDVLRLDATDATYTTGKPGIGGFTTSARWDALTAGNMPPLSDSLTGGLWIAQPPENVTEPYGTMEMTAISDADYYAERQTVELEIMLYHRPRSNQETLEGYADTVDEALLRYVDTTSNVILVRDRSRQTIPSPVAPEDRDLCAVRLVYSLAVWPAHLTQYSL